MTAALAPETPDVLVVGLGPAGARAATAAAASGLGVVVLERRAEAGSPVQCAELVPALLDHAVCGIAAATDQLVRRMLTCLPGADPDVTANFPGRMIDRAAFDRLLAKQAAEAGAVCRYAAPLQAIEADGLVCSTDRCLRPRLLIGADGPRSRVGAAIASSNRDLVETRQVSAALLRPHDATDIFLRPEYPGGYGWLFPKGASANIGIGLAPGARQRLKPLLAALHRELAAAGRVGAEAGRLTGGSIPVGGRLRAVGRLGKVPVLLAGDAAGLTNPVTGAGIAAAVQSGTLAGEAAARWLGGSPTALDDYEEELGDLFDAALARARRRRGQLLATYESGALPGRGELRAAWIAYPEYWAA